MKAIVHTQYGSPEVLTLQEIEKPSPKDNEVLIKIHATTVNRTDCGFLRGKPYIVRLFSGLMKPRRTTLGSEVAGMIEKVGKDVTSFKAGDKVFGLCADVFGGHAEYVCLPEDEAITTMPKNMSYAEAAAICEGPWLALFMLRKMKITRGQRVLINGGTGSIGSSAVQLAKYFGTHVTAVCDTKHLEFVKSLGADEVINYTHEDFTKRSASFDLVFDAVGKSTYFKCKQILAENGIYVSTEFGPYVQNPFLALWGVFFGKKKVLFPIPFDTKDDIIFFKELAEAGHLRAVIDRKYPLADVPDAYRYAETGMKTGSLVIVVE